MGEKIERGEFSSFQHTIFQANTPFSSTEIHLPGVSSKQIEPQQRRGRRVAQRDKRTHFPPIEALFDVPIQSFSSPSLVRGLKRVFVEDDDSKSAGVGKLPHREP